MKKRSDTMANKDITYLKEKTDEILKQVKETNGTVRAHDVKIVKLEQNQSNHFHNHDEAKKDKKSVEKWSRRKLLFWGAIIFIILRFLLDLLREKLFGG